MITRCHKDKKKIYEHTPPLSIQPHNWSFCIIAKGLAISIIAAVRTYILQALCMRKSENFRKSKSTLILQLIGCHVCNEKMVLQNWMLNCTTSTRKKLQTN